jgi:hypothetical protein
MLLSRTVVGQLVGPVRNTANRKPDQLAQPCPRTTGRYRYGHGRHLPAMPTSRGPQRRKDHAGPQVLNARADQRQGGRGAAGSARRPGGRGRSRPPGGRTSTSTARSHAPTPSGPSGSRTCRRPRATGSVLGDRWPPSRCSSPPPSTVPSALGSRVAWCGQRWQGRSAPPPWVDRRATQRGGPDALSQVAHAGIRHVPLVADAARASTVSARLLDAADRTRAGTRPAVGVAGRRGATRRALPRQRTCGTSTARSRRWTRSAPTTTGSA